MHHVPVVPRWTRDQWLLFALSMVCLQPYSIGIGGVGVSANYLFVFVPLIMAAAGSPRPLVVRGEALCAVLFFWVVYVLGVRFDLAALDGGADPALRRLASFIAFLLPFSLAFVRFRPNDLEVFKMAVVVEAARYALMSIVRVVPLLATTPIDQLKALIGSQRYGFILCLALFIVLDADRLIVRRGVLAQRLALAAVLLIGIVLTFSRASIVACVVGLLVVMTTTAWAVVTRRRTGRPRQEGRRVRTGGALATFGLLVVVMVMIPSATVSGIWEFYVVRLIEPALDSTLLATLSEGDVATSEGYRGYMWTKVLGYLAVHPLLGSSFQGVYLMFPEFREGGHSAHGQYLDILSRTGLLGFAVWSALLGRLMWFCRRDRGLLAGMMGVLAYGVFHETFKLSQGGFVFAMLLSFAYLPAAAWQSATSARTAS